MSIIFGIRKNEGAAVLTSELYTLARATARYAPDGLSVGTYGRIGMGFQPYYTHLRSRLDAQPVVGAGGNVLTFDGRLDNHQELSDLLDIRRPEMSDSRLVLAAFERWGEDCFSRLVGDWALAIWASRERSLYLVRDHAGTRTLHVGRLPDGSILWSTYLETFFAGGQSFEVNRAYAASYLANYPIDDLTPYNGITAVTPAHYLIFRDSDRLPIRKPHWRWFVNDRIRYATDAQYEDHFLSLFKRAVERRTVSGAPILAELSGGMDSSSIVCMSDHIFGDRGTQSASGVTTLSYYDDGEPHWNELPFVQIVEAARGKQGIHLRTSFAERRLSISIDTPQAYLYPGSDAYAFERERELQTRFESNDFRVILSGIGGDELLGGVPTPIPELADYLVFADLKSVLYQSIAWSIARRTTVYQMLLWVFAEIFGRYATSRATQKPVIPWLSFEGKRLLLNGHPTFAMRPSPLSPPSTISNGLAWWTLLETPPHLHPAALFRLEYRYPYLDRDLVDFLFRVPRQQLLRPGERRSLMRRALARYVPREILARRQKAFLSRGPMKLLQAEQVNFATCKEWKATQLGLVDPVKLTACMDAALQNAPSKWTLALLKTLTFEVWLRSAPNIRAAAS